MFLSSIVSILSIFLRLRVYAAAQLTTCSNGEKLIQVDFFTDIYPDESSWTVTNICTQQVVLSGGPYEGEETTYTDQVCVPDGGIYDFTVFDSYYDGMCHTDDDSYYDGSFTVSYDGVQVVTGDCDFNATVSHFFGETDTGDKLLIVNFLTDYYPDENSWTVKNVCSDTVVLSGGPYEDSQTLHQYKVCVPKSRYEITVYDSESDGMCDPNIDSFVDGLFTITYGGEEAVTGSCDFISSTTQAFGETLCDCPSGEKLLEVSFLTDVYPAESSWNVTNVCSNTLVLSGGPYNSTETVYNHQICVDEGLYEIKVYDSETDGMCHSDTDEYADGSFTVNYGEVLVVSGDCDFNASISHSFGDSCIPSSRSPSKSLSNHFMFMSMLIMFGLYA